MLIAALLPPWRSPAPQRQFRVLIVDDSPHFRRVARELLEYRGYVVAGEAASAREALEAVQAMSPDAALVDIRLPDMDGAELAVYLRTHYPAVSVLLTSADPELDPDALVALTGAVGFISKSELGGKLGPATGLAERPGDR